MLCMSFCEQTVFLYFVNYPINKNAVLYTIVTTNWKLANGYLKMFKFLYQ